MPLFQYTTELHFIMKNSFKKTTYMHIFLKIVGQVTPGATLSKKRR